MQIAVAPPDFAAWPDLLSLLQDAFAYMDARIDPPWSLARMGVDDLQAKARKEALILATENATLIGCAYADVREDCVYVGKVAVAQPARGRGVARALLAAAEDLARQHRRDCLELQTRIELIENHRTFAALGFVTVAETAHSGYDRPTSITMRKSLEPAQALKHYVYVLRLVERLHDPQAWTEHDNASVQAHFKRLQDGVASGQVVLAGRTDEPLNTSFGLVIFQAATDDEARQFMASDPTVVDGVMRAELHPYSLALMRSN